MKGLLGLLLITLIIGCQTPIKTNDLPVKDDDAEKIAVLFRQLNQSTQKHARVYANMNLSFDTGTCGNIEINDVYLDSIPEVINKFRELQWLELNGCYLTTIKGLNDTNLMGITLKGNKFTSVYPLLLMLPKSLMKLDLEDNSLKGIVTIDSFPPLYEIDLSYNHITGLVFKHPERCALLGRIIINSTEISELDSSIYLLPNLTNIIMNNTLIENIKIQNLKSLRVLSVDKDFHFSGSDLSYIKSKDISIDRE